MVSRTRLPALKIAAKQFTPDRHDAAAFRCPERAVEIAEENLERRA